MLGEVTIDTQGAGSLSSILQHVVNHLVIHSHTTKEGTFLGLAGIVGISGQTRMVLRRVGGAYHHVTCVGIFHQEVLEELGTALQHGVDVSQIGLVAREEVLLPEV